MKVMDYPYVVFVESRSSVINRIFFRRRGFMTIDGAQKYLRRVRCSSFVLSACII